MLINDSEREEMKRLAKSSSLREDLMHLKKHRHNPVIAHGRVDMDRLLTFLTEYNEFINHRPKAFKPIKDKVMKL